jgi:hypothetical protein
MKLKGAVCAPLLLLGAAEGYGVTYTRGKSAKVWYFFGDSSANQPAACTRTHAPYSMQLTPRAKAFRSVEAARSNVGVSQTLQPQASCSDVCASANSARLCCVCCTARKQASDVSDVSEGLLTGLWKSVTGQTVRT